MRYYTIKYTDSLPPAFGGEANGPMIRIRPKHRNDVGLLEHEKFHVREWWAWFLVMALLSLGVSLAVGPMIGLPLLLWAPLAHDAAYQRVRRYRQWSEVKAYRIQLGMGRYVSPDFAVAALAEKYDLRLSRERARQLLGLSSMSNTDV